MYTKSQYRALYNELKPKVKLSYFAKEYGLSPVTLSRFMQDEAFDFYMSIDKLDGFYSYLINRLHSL